MEEQLKSRLFVFFFVLSLYPLLDLDVCRQGLELV